MLKVVSKPIRIERSSDLIVILRGNDDAIDAVIAQRKDERGCRQGKFFTPEYYVRVRYSVAEDGLIHIVRVEVSSDRAHWSSFFNRAKGQEGERHVCRNQFHFYYLDDLDGLDGVYEALERFEDDQAVTRLAAAGPSAFDFEDEVNAIDPSELRPFTHPGGRVYTQ